MNEVMVVEPTEIQTQADTPIVIDKLFGPAILWPIRVTAKLSGKRDESDYWLIECLREVFEDGELKEEWIPYDKIPAAGGK